MAHKRKISQEEWDRILPAMETFADITTQIAYLVLVKDEKQSDVATHLARSKQNVGNAVKRVWDLYTELENAEGRKLHFVSVWIPEEEAIKVKKIAAKFPINKISS
ncbi:transcriptional regulator KorA [Erwinia rhapontici]|uniref:transcriptional regulator KorA n=1 Tax=Erwinia rhapontici TaxID=55212 RepID=UPI002166CEA7|nr:transcriptional regulator KorA [Erwinia rhapontici]MCS3609540.1 dsDNA-binding SOS-regulon protein [Erwinia rhapontici]HBR2605931.1 transcriptional regulator KorA [Klebsiella pneumoniae]